MPLPPSGRLVAVLAVLAFALPGCALERSGLLPEGRDGALPPDATSMDGGSDAAPPDAVVPRDTGVDAVAPPEDAGPRDTGPMDAGPRDTGPMDAGPMDTGPMDTGPMDTGPMDTGPMDTGPPDTGPPDTGPPACGATYGGATGFMLCVERADECEFFTRLDGVRTCTSTCAAFGGTCLRRWRDSSPPNECRHQDSASRDCGTTGNDTDICVCTR